MHTIYAKKADSMGTNKHRYTSTHCMNSSMYETTASTNATASSIACIHGILLLIIIIICILLFRLRMYAYLRVYPTQYDLAVLHCSYAVYVSHMGYDFFWSHHDPHKMKHYRSAEMHHSASKYVTSLLEHDQCRQPSDSPTHTSSRSPRTLYTASSAKYVKSIAIIHIPLNTQTHATFVAEARTNGAVLTSPVK